MIAHKRQGRTRAYAGSAIAALALVAGAAWAELPRGDDAALLRRWTMARCVAHAYDAPEVKRDAAASAAAYLEAGNSDSEAYEAIERLIVLQLDTPYASKHGEALQMMKCIDLLESKALRELIGAYTRVRMG